MGWGEVKEPVGAAMAAVRGCFWLVIVRWLGSGSSSVPKRHPRGNVARIWVGSSLTERSSNALVELFTTQQKSGARQKIVVATTAAAIAGAIAAVATAAVVIAAVAIAVVDPIPNRCLFSA